MPDSEISVIERKFVRHPLLKEGAVEERGYQTAIVAHAVKENVLAVLPTGLGKTPIALRTIAEWLRTHEGTKALFLAPTRPLVEQHAARAAEMLTLPPPLVLTGTVAPSRRGGSGDAPVVVATPQVILNDFERGALSPRDFTITVFDEAHRARGDYPYVGIAQRVNGPHQRILGITASPGSTSELVEEVMKNLAIEATGLEVRYESDADIAPYLHDILGDLIYVDRPREAEEAGVLLRKALSEHVRKLSSFFPPLASAESPSRKIILDAGREIDEIIRARRARGENPAAYWQAKKFQAAAMKIAYAIELLETQGPESLRKYWESQRQKRKERYSPSTDVMLKDEYVQRALELALRQTSDHPKVQEVVKLVRTTLHAEGAHASDGTSNTRVLVFANYRDTADLLVRRLKSLDDGAIRAERFVGQATKDSSDKGLSQHEQVGLLRQFREGKINCLVATSVAEEGLDVPATDLVVFYEPVPSVIRTIQRRGRTGRSRSGRVVMLLTRGTQDVGSYYSSKGKEKKMRRLIEELRGRMSAGPTPPKLRRSSLDDWGATG